MIKDAINRAKLLNLQRIPAKMRQLFTYPFRYSPSAEVIQASRELIARISGDPSLHALFAEGKMMGVLVCDEGVLYGFSGLAGGRAVVDGFVPPVFDYTDPEGYFRKMEAVISELCSASELSKNLQDWLFEQYVVMNGRGEEKSVKEIFAQRGMVPPGGTGECAAPKLLDYAFRHGMTPRSMGEFWYGASPKNRVREQGRFYPSCTGKCGPLLTWMLQGVEVETNPLDAPFLYAEPRVLYSDESIIVVDKPGGMLSVPGKTSAPCLLDWLSERYGQVHSCHRLDQDTSGVMVYARRTDVKSALEAQFAAREVHKVYRARLSASLVGSDGVPSCAGPFNHARRGTIALPLMLDYYERPCQMVDYESGKKAVTRYEVLEIFPDGEIDVRFYPQTGRTHQLRVHAAHPDGLGRPIKGDHLYGAPDGGRLFLMAESITFVHPDSCETMTFSV